MKILFYIAFLAIFITGCSTVTGVSREGSAASASANAKSEEYVFSPKSKTVTAEYFIGQSNDGNQLIIKARLQSFAMDRLDRVVVRSNGKHQTCFSESEVLECSLNIFDAFGVQPIINESTTISFDFYDAFSNVIKSSSVTVDYRKHFKFVNIERDNVATFSSPSPTARTKVVLKINSKYPIYEPKKSESFVAIYKDGLIFWIPKSLVKPI
jgi:hypothetical protein